jgi:hypothetical protein
MIDEFHKYDYVIFKNTVRSYKDDPVIERKILKDSIVLKKLFFACCNVGTPIIEWKNNDVTTLSIASLEKTKSTPHLHIAHSHNRTRSHLSLKTLTFFDLMTSTDVEIEYNQIEKIIIQSSQFDDVEKLMQQTTMKF